MSTMKSEKEINELLNKAYENVDNGESKYPNSSWEQGIINGIEWIMNTSEDSIIDDFLEEK